jgi:hypothetical protein
MLIMSTGTGSIRLSHMARLSRGFQHPSLCFELCSHQCRSGLSCIMVAAMQQPIAIASVIAITETHISPLLSAMSTTAALDLRKWRLAGWFVGSERTGQS